jgi:hypothetical protein
VENVDQDLKTLVIILIVAHNPSTRSTYNNDLFNITGNSNVQPRSQPARHSISVPLMRTNQRSHTPEVPRHLVSNHNPRVLNVQNNTREGNNI